MKRVRDAGRYCYGPAGRRRGVRHTRRATGALYLRASVNRVVQPSLRPRRNHWGGTTGFDSTRFSLSVACAAGGLTLVALERGGAWQTLAYASVLSVVATDAVSSGLPFCPCAVVNRPPAASGGGA